MDGLLEERSRGLSRTNHPDQVKWLHKFEHDAARNPSAITPTSHEPGMTLMCGGSWAQDVMQSYKIELREVQKGACLVPFVPDA